jgi:hypothetical protein
LGGVGASLGGTSALGGVGASLGGAAALGGIGATLGGASALGGVGATLGGATGLGGAASTRGGASMSGGGVASNAGANATGGVSASTGGTATLGGSSPGGSNSTGGITATGGTTYVSPIVITTSTIPAAQTNEAYSATVTATGVANYAWTLASGSLPPGFTLQGTNSASVTISGTTAAAGLYPLQLSVTDGTDKQTVNLSLGVTHPVAFLADRATAGQNELYLARVGAESLDTPVKVNANVGGSAVTSFKWSPDGSRIAYLVDNGNGLYVTQTSSPGVASYVGGNVKEYVWLNEGQTLAFVTDDTAYVVDVSATTLTLVPVVLPEVPSGQVRSVSGLIASPSGTSFAINYSECVIGQCNTPEGAKERGSYYLNWAQGGNVTAAKLFLVSGTYSPPGPSFSSDGALALMQPGFAAMTAYDLTNPAAPTPLTVPLAPFAEFNPTSHDLLVNMTTTEVGYAHFATGGWTTTTLVARESSLTPLGWSPNGKHVLIQWNQDVRLVANASTAATNSDVSLLPDGVASAGVDKSPWSPDSSWITMVSHNAANNTNDLYLVRWTGPAPATAVSSMIAGSSTTRATRFAPNSSAVAFNGNVLDATIKTLHLSLLPPTGPATPAVALTNASQPSVRADINWLPGSKVVLYRAADPGGDQLHLIHIGANGSASAPLSISGLSSGVASYQIAP